MACVAWSSLPADLLQDISCRLSSDADHLHIHQVCTHWRASISSLAAFRPWVLTGSTNSDELLAPFSDYYLRLPRPAAESMELGAPPVGLPYCCGASFGWLALVDNESYPTRLVLWEPVSNAEVPLPCLSVPSRIFISGDPLTSSRWVAIATQRKDQVALMRTVLVWRPGEAAWTNTIRIVYEYGAREIEAIACTFHGGKAYYMDEDIIVICDLDTATHLPPTFTPIYGVHLAAKKLCRCDRFHPVRGMHLVACNGDLLLVVLRFQGSGHPSWAEVYKPEWTFKTNYSRVQLRKRVMDLGDYSLFLCAPGHAFALSAKEFPAIKRNCIYYTDGPYDNRRCLSVFNLESGVVEEIPYLDELQRGKAKRRSYGWFCPRAPFSQAAATLKISCFLILWA